MFLLQRSLRNGQCFTETELYRGDVTITIAWVVIAAFPFSLSTVKTKYTQWECYFKKYDFYSCCPINIYIYTKTAAKYHSPKYGGAVIPCTCGYICGLNIVHPITSQLGYLSNFDIGHKVFIRYTSWTLTVVKREFL